MLKTKNKLLNSYEKIYVYFNTNNLAKPYIHIKLVFTDKLQKVFYHFVAVNNSNPASVS